MTGWNKIAGWYAIIFAVINLIIQIFLLFYLFRINGTGGFVGVFISMIPLILLIFLGNQIIKERYWSKIIALIILIWLILILNIIYVPLISSIFYLRIPFFILILQSTEGIGKIVYLILYLIGVVLISLSLKKKK